MRLSEGTRCSAADDGAVAGLALSSVFGFFFALVFLVVFFLASFRSSSVVMVMVEGELSDSTSLTILRNNGAFWENKYEF